MIEETAAQKKTAKTEEKSEEAALDEILRPLSVEEEAQVAAVNSLYSKLGSLSLNELLGVDERADSETIKKNYYRLTKKYHPDKHFTFADPDTKTKLTTIFDALTKAYNTLKDDKLKAEYFQSLAAPKKMAGAGESRKAEEQFKRGITEFKKGNFQGAIDNFKGAIKLKPDSPTYLSYLSLAYSKVPGKL